MYGNQLKIKDFKNKNQNKGMDDSVKIQDVDEKLQVAGIGPVVKLQHLKNIDFLGQGSYAFVKLAFDSEKNQKVALKIFEKKTLVVKRRLQNLFVR